MKTRILSLVALLFAVASFAQPRAEYPRPQFERTSWINLNGEWSFTLDLANTGAERNYYNSKGFDSKITVPFAPESKLSGIGLRIYRRYTTPTCSKQHQSSTLCVCQPNRQESELYADTIRH